MWKLKLLFLDYHSLRLLHSILHEKTIFLQGNKVSLSQRRQRNRFGKLLRLEPVIDLRSLLILTGVSSIAKTILHGSVGCAGSVGIYQSLNREQKTPVYCNAHRAIPIMKFPSGVSMT